MHLTDLAIDKKFSQSTFEKSIRYNTQLKLKPTKMNKAHPLKIKGYKGLRPM